MGRAMREAKKVEAAFPAREVRKTASGLASSYVGRPIRQQGPGKVVGSDSEDERRLEARVKVCTRFLISLLCMSFDELLLLSPFAASTRRSFLDGIARRR